MKYSRRYYAVFIAFFVLFAWLQWPMMIHILHSEHSNTQEMTHEQYLPLLPEDLIPPSLRQLCAVPEKLMRTQLHKYSKLHQTQQSSPKKYFIALNLFNNEAVIPTITAVLRHLANFLGKENIFISIYENGSTDTTPHLLKSFETELNDRNISNRIVTASFKTNWTSVNRIDELAEYRNRALEPMFNSSSHFDQLLFVNDGTIHFI